MDNFPWNLRWMKKVLLKRAGKDVLLPSRLGLVLKNAPSLVSGFAFYEKYGVH